MQLKRLELSGFKSFARRTVLEFGPGVTAVVGPNGSGKSNITDAVRWVLGEQNARLLRGSRMEDVIFNGTANRRALGLAEVSLTFDNSTGVIPIDFNEISLGRRIDRVGNSDYLINGMPCRLRDVQELLYDTGLGRDAYTMVGQGRIDEILAAKSADRRALLEEAAGIVKFKARRHEARRRLDQVEQRLTRLGDIVGELRARLGPLELEAERAAHHRRLKQELDNLERLILLAQARRLYRQLQQRRQAVADAGARVKEARQKLVANQERQAELRRVAAQAEAALEGAREALQRLAGEGESLNARRQVLSERRDFLRQRRKQFEQQLTALEQELATKSGESDVDREHLESRRQQLEQLQAERKQVESSLAAADEQLAAIQQRLSAARTDAARLVERLGQNRDAVATAVSELDGWQQKRAGLEHRIAVINQELSAAHRQRRQWVDRRQAILADSTQSQRALAGASARLEATQAELKNREQQLRAAQEQLAAAKGRLETLVELDRANQGFYAGVRAVLRGRDAGAAEFGDVIGVVAELLSVQPAYEAAVEAALGGAVQNLITMTARGAQRAIEALRAKGAGRATFLPIDSLRPSAKRQADDRLLNLDGVIGWATTLVEHDPQIRPAIEHLLGRVLVTNDLSSARRAAREVGFTLRIVTLEGDVVHPGGAMTGGSRANERPGSGSAGGLLGRQRQLETLRARVRDLTGQCRQLAGELTRLQHRMAEYDAARVRAREALGGYERELDSVARELAAFDRLAGELTREQSGLERELETAAANLQSLQQRVAEGQEAAEALETEVAAAQDLVSKLEQELSGRQAAFAGQRERLVQLSAETTALAEQIQTLSNWGERAQRERELLAQRLEGGRGELAELDQQLQQCDVELRSAAAAVSNFSATYAAAEGALAAARTDRQQALAAVNAAVTEYDQLRDVVEKHAQQLHRAELEFTRVQAEWDRLSRQLEEQGVLVSTDDVDWDQGLPDPGELNAASKRARELSRELEQLGPVNPGAEDEFRTLRRRYQFISGQMEDLTTARARLEQLIAQIDSHMDRLFKATFLRLREKFQYVFYQLFGGGRADLVLEEPQVAATQPGIGGDQLPGELEAVGVEILAQPPGKRMQPLALLSGGERALTAIALLFAMLEVKPPPFCILDEIEAALDDSNLQRFLNYLAELSKRIQFIVVTHQKRTMAIADALYGITLGEDGASRLVAVRLADVAGAVEA